MNEEPLNIHVYTLCLLWLAHFLERGQFIEAAQIKHIIEQLKDMPSIEMPTKEYRDLVLGSVRPKEEEEK